MGNNSTLKPLASSGVLEIQATDRAFAAIRRDGSVVAWGDPTAGGNCSSKAEPNLGFKGIQICNSVRVLGFFRVKGLGGISVMMMAMAGVLPQRAIFKLVGLVLFVGFEKVDFFFFCGLFFQKTGGCRKRGNFRKLWKGCYKDCGISGSLWFIVSKLLSY